MVARTVDAEHVLMDDGAVVLAPDVLARAGVIRGSRFFAYADGPGSIRLRFVDGLTPDELFERYGDPAITEIDWPNVRAEIEEEMARDRMDRLRRDG